MSFSASRSRVSSCARGPTGAASGSRLEERARTGVLQAGQVADGGVVGCGGGGGGGGTQGVGRVVGAAAAGERWRCRASWAGADLSAIVGTFYAACADNRVDVGELVPNCSSSWRRLPSWHVVREYQ